MSHQSRARQLRRQAEHQASQREHQLEGRAVAQDVVEQLADRTGPARLVYTILTTQRARVAQTYWQTRHGRRSYHVLLTQPEQTSIIVEMTLPPASLSSVLVMASKSPRPEVTDDPEVLTRWLAPDLAPGSP